MKRRVVVTGLGAVSPFGVGVPSLWDNAKAGKSGIEPITLFDTADFPVKFAGEVKGFDPLSFYEKKEARHLDRVSQFALVCAEEARADAQLDLDSVDRTRVGAIIGSGIGTWQYRQRRQQSAVSVSPNPGAAERKAEDGDLAEAAEDNTGGDADKNSVGRDGSKDIPGSASTDELSRSEGREP